MTDPNGKKAVVLNYGMMMSDLQMVLTEQTEFMHHFFMRDESLAQDTDLQDIGKEFHNFLVAFKRLNETIENVSAHTLK